MCGTEFVPSKFNIGIQKYCSGICRYKYWVKNNRIRSRAIKKAWKKRNWDKVLEGQRRLFKIDRAKRPEYYRMLVKNRKALIRMTSNSGKTFSTSFTLQEWEQIKKDCGYVCKICQRKEPEIKLTIDHIYPLSKGGRHCKENIQALCHSCNSRKKDRIDSVPCIRHTDIENSTPKMCSSG